MKFKWISILALLTCFACSDEPEDSTTPPPDAEDDSFALDRDSKSDANGIGEGSWEAFCVLNYANSANEQELLDDLHSFPAGRIWSARVGPDGVLGTEDDGFFETVKELDRVPWVGFFTFRSMLNKARETGLCPELGEETLFPDEEELAEEIARLSEDEVRENYMNDTIARRDAHAKAHGCVRATMTVDNSELTPEDRVGVFAENRSFPAWIRFSNGNPVIQNDKERDARGMAIKLMEVPGDKVLDRHRNEATQDFLLINGPAFFVRTASDYLEFTKKAFDGEVFSYFLGLNPLEWRIRELTNVLRIAGSKPSSPITQYWSTVPYALGDGPAVKYTAKPCGEFDSGFPDDPTPDFLGETLAEELESGPQCFEFMVQRQIDAAGMPIEDSTIEWEESDSSFVKVATIDIPQQTFLSEEQVGFCENLSFNPWHTLPEHRPLGNINRTRRLVYDAISQLRHQLNAAPREEPTEHIIFE